MFQRKAGTIFFAFLLLSIGKSSSISTENNTNLKEASFTENFEDGIQNWILEDGWSIERLDNNTVLRGTGHWWAKIKSGTWTNYSLEVKFKPVKGIMHLNYRFSDQKDDLQRYFVGVGIKNLYLNKQIGNRFYQLTNSQIQLNNSWHKIEVKGYGSFIDVSIEGTLFIHYKDETPILGGKIAFETLENSEFLIDDIKIDPVMAIAEVTSSQISASIINQTRNGRIWRNETWEGVIHVTGDIIVEEGVTLTIKPGTKVLIATDQDVENLFTSPFDMQQGIQTADDFSHGVHRGEPFRDEGHHISIRIYGTLIAIGTAEQPITISSDNPTPTVYDWNYLEFDHGILSYSFVEFYRCLLPGNGTEVSHNHLKHVGECAICANKRSMLIENNNISYAIHELIDMHQSAPIIRNNHLGPNPDHCGIVIDGGSPQVLGNTIEGCQAGICIISPSQPILEKNFFFNNGKDIFYTHN